MTGFNHALVGIGIAVGVGNPILIAPLALVSHFLLDAFPHFYLRSFGDTITRPYARRLLWFLAMDGIVTLSFVIWAIYLWPQLWLAITVGVFFAMAPDILWPLNGRVEALKKFFQFHRSNNLFLEE